MITKWLGPPLTFLLFFLLVAPAVSLTDSAEVISSHGKITTPAPTPPCGDSHDFYLFAEPARHGWTVAEAIAYLDGGYVFSSFGQTCEALAPSFLSIKYYNPRSCQIKDTNRSEYFINNGWIQTWLKTGTPISIADDYWMVDWAVPAWRTYQVNEASAYVRQYGFDGIQWDNHQLSTMATYTARSQVDNTDQPVSSVYGTWEASEIAAAYLALDDAYDAADPDGYQLINSGLNGPTFSNTKYNAEYLEHLPSCKWDQIMCERIFYGGNMYDASAQIDYAEWLQVVDVLQWLEEYFPGEAVNTPLFDRSFYNSVSFNGIAESYPKDMTVAEYEDWFLFGIGTLYMTFDSDPLEHWIWAEDYARYDFAQNCRNLNLGLPTGNYTIAPWTYIYSRNFQHGRVLVNPSNSPYTITVGSGWVDAVRGAPVASTITLADHTALVLVSQ